MRAPVEYDGVPPPTVRWRNRGRRSTGDKSLTAGRQLQPAIVNSTQLPPPSLSWAPPVAAKKYGCLRRLATLAIPPNSLGFAPNSLGFNHFLNCEVGAA